MTRRTHITLLGAALAAGSTAVGKENNQMRELLDASQNEKKGVNVYANSAVSWSASIPSMPWPWLETRVLRRRAAAYLSVNLLVLVK